MTVKLAFICLALLFIGHAYAYEHIYKSEADERGFGFLRNRRPQRSNGRHPTGRGGTSTSTSAPFDSGGASAHVALDDGGDKSSQPSNKEGLAKPVEPTADKTKKPPLLPPNQGNMVVNPVGATTDKPQKSPLLPPNQGNLINPVGATTDNTQRPPSQALETKFKGIWELHSANAGVSAMHLMILPNNKAVMFDATTLGKSELPFPEGHCAMLDGKLDCWAHAAVYDLDSAKVRPLKVETDTWCSSGGLTPDGVLVQAGGNLGGGKTVRRLELCETCDWKEYVNALGNERWYATQQVLPDGRFIVVGGRGSFNYEFLPAPGQINPAPFKLPFLQETTDPIDQSENNLYPHVHLSTDGNLFIFANTKSILYDPNNHRVIRNYPELPGGPRNYPGSAPSVVLPIEVPPTQDKNLPVTVAICGGGQKYAYDTCRFKKQLLPALKSCARIKITDPNPIWEIEDMPGPRVMADMLILPTGDLIIINGAKAGSGGWEFAEDPYYAPVLYRPCKPKEERFQELAPTTIARMYHSTAAILPDGKVLVAGSSTHQGYQYVNVKYPTELRVEKFSPPYLDPALAKYSPIIQTNFNDQPMYKHGDKIDLEITVGGEEVLDQDLKVTMFSPPFTTHGYSMNQRLLILPISDFSKQGERYKFTVTLPQDGAVAPPGYYMLFVVNRGIPSKAAWMRLQV